MTLDDETPSTPPLYDFLYRDPVRVPSLIAQLAGGLVTTAEKTKGETKGREFGAGLKSILKLGWDDKFSSDVGDKTILNPHDYLLADLITRLAIGGYISSNPATAPTGSVVRATGDLGLFDGALLTTGFAQIGNHLAIAMSEQAGVDAGFMRAAFNVVAGQVIPPMYTLTSGTGMKCGGSLKPAGLVDPVSATLVCHGNRPLKNTHVLGIKEDSVTRPQSDGETPFQKLNALGDVLSKQFFGEEVFRIAPILIYRFIEPHGATADHSDG